MGHDASTLAPAGAKLTLVCSVQRAGRPGRKPQRRACFRLGASRAVMGGARRPAVAGGSHDCRNIAGTHRAIAA